MIAKADKIFHVGRWLAASIGGVLVRLELHALQHVLKRWAEAIGLRFGGDEHEVDHRPVGPGDGDQPVALFLLASALVRKWRGGLQGDFAAAETSDVDGLRFANRLQSAAALKVADESGGDLVDGHALALRRRYAVDDDSVADAGAGQSGLWRDGEGIASLPGRVDLPIVGMGNLHKAEVGRDQTGTGQHTLQRDGGNVLTGAGRDWRAHRYARWGFERGSIFLVKHGPLARLRTLCNLLAGVGFDGHRLLTNLIEGDVAGQISLGWPRQDLFLNGLLAVAGIGVIA